MQDQIILRAINSTLSEQMLFHVTRRATAKDAWTTLASLFVSQSHACTMQTHYQLATLKKGNSTVADYFQQFQTLTDHLVAVGQPINDFEKVSFLLAGFGSEYDPFVTSITIHADPLSIEEIYGHLLTHELRLEKHHTSLDLMVAEANFVSRHASHRGSRGGCNNSTGHHNSGNGSPSGSNSRPYQGSNLSFSPQQSLQLPNLPIL